MSTSVSAAAALLPILHGRRSPPASRVPTICRRRIGPSPRLFSSSSPSFPILPAAAMATAPAASDAGSKSKLLVFDSKEDLAVSLAKYTAELSQKFAAERGAFTAVLSGGSLIDALSKLTEPPYLESVDWSKWHVFWVDERVVPKDHEDSNYKLAFDGFLSKVPIPPGQVYAINDALSAELVYRQTHLHPPPRSLADRPVRRSPATCLEFGHGQWRRLPPGAVLLRGSAVAARAAGGAAGAVGRGVAGGAAREAGGAGDAGLRGHRRVPRRRLLPGPPRARAGHRGSPPRRRHLPRAPRGAPPAGLRRAHRGVPGRALLREGRRRGAVHRGGAQEPLRVRQGRRRADRHQGHAGVPHRGRHVEGRSSRQGGGRRRRGSVRRGAVQHPRAAEALRAAGGRRQGPRVVPAAGHHQGAQGQEGIRGGEPREAVARRRQAPGPRRQQRGKIVASTSSTARQRGRACSTDRTAAA